MTWTIYILKCTDDTLYTGITNDLENRIAIHESGKGAKYLRGRGPFTIVYTEAHMTKSAALKRELKIKSLSKNDKLSLCITETN